MANPEQLGVLKSGVKAWNRWREEHPDVIIDFSEANLVNSHCDKANLERANFNGAHLAGTQFRGAKLNSATFRKAQLDRAALTRATLYEADLYGADLRESDFYEANLSGAKLVSANLTEAILSRAKLNAANFSRAKLLGAKLNDTDLTGANFSEAELNGANLNRAHLIGANLLMANLAGAMLGETLLVDVDLSETKGLDKVKHRSPSPISTSTVESSRGKIPSIFLRGCGLSDLEIEFASIYQQGLPAREVNDIVYRIFDLRANRAIQINPLFISYSHKDSTFVDTMEKRLDEKGIRFWRDVNDMPSGRLEKVVDRAMRQNPTVLLVLSGNSVQSDWVEHEARSARELEKELGRDVLCPVALDDAWKDCQWPARLREQIEEYHIMDFSNWKDEVEFGKKFAKLIEGLDLFYKENQRTGDVQPNK